MSDVTGPISTLPGSLHECPEGTPCDDCGKPATIRMQGETDSFGCEMWDICDDCAKQMRADLNSEEARTGTCDWCHELATDLRDRRDAEEGMYGRVYRVCGACVKRDNDYWASFDDDRWS